MVFFRWIMLNSSLFSEINMPKGKIMCTEVQEMVVNYFRRKVYDSVFQTGLTCPNVMCQN